MKICCIGVEKLRKTAAIENLQLTDTYPQTGGVIWLDRHQVSRNDLEGVVVNAEDESRASGAVDETDEMLLAGCKLRIEIASRARGRIMPASVYDDAVCSGEIRLCLLVLVCVESCLMDVVLDKDWPQIYVPVTTGWTMDNEGSYRTLYSCKPLV